MRVHEPGFWRRAWGTGLVVGGLLLATAALANSVTTGAVTATLTNTDGTTAATSGKLTGNYTKTAGTGMFQGATNYGFNNTAALEAVTTVTSGTWHDGLLYYRASVIPGPNGASFWWQSCPQTTLQTFAPATVGGSSIVAPNNWTVDWDQPNAPGSQWFPNSTQVFIKWQAGASAGSLSASQAQL